VKGVDSSVRKRKTLTGQPILTAVKGNNDDIFPGALRIYLPSASQVVDVTWGKGNFWTPDLEQEYRIIRNDFMPLPGIDLQSSCVNIPFADGVFDGVVFDPPYLSSTGHSRQKMSDLARSMNEQYQTLGTTTFKSVDDVLSFYLAGIREAYRILRRYGVLFVKCQGAIESARQYWTLFNLKERVEDLGFQLEDLFVLVRNGHSPVGWDYQCHAKRNHSWLMVFVKNEGHPVVWGKVSAHRYVWKARRRDKHEQLALL